MIELYHDNFQNYKRYNIKKAQLVIADIPYNIVCGSGTTLRAAAELKRDAYGFETSTEYYTKAKKEMLKDYLRKE